jgi:hypothetical protein
MFFIFQLRHQRFERRRRIVHPRHVHREGVRDLARIDVDLHAFAAAFLWQPPAQGELAEWQARML